MHLSTTAPVTCMHQSRNRNFLLLASLKRPCCMHWLRHCLWRHLDARKCPACMRWLRHIPWSYVAALKRHSRMHWLPFSHALMFVFAHGIKVLANPAQASGRSLAKQSLLRILVSPFLLSHLAKQASPGKQASSQCKPFPQKLACSGMRRTTETLTFNSNTTTIEYSTYHW